MWIVAYLLSFASLQSTNTISTLQDGEHVIKQRSKTQRNTNKSLSNTKNALPSHHEGQDSRWGPGDRAGPESDNIEKLWNVCGEERILMAEVTLQEVYS